MNREYSVESVVYLLVVDGSAELETLRRPQ